MKLILPVALNYSKKKYENLPRLMVFQGVLSAKQRGKILTWINKQLSNNCKVCFFFLWPAVMRMIGNALNKGEVLSDFSFNKQIFYTA